jgi:hypothetical protein
MIYFRFQLSMTLQNHPRPSQRQENKPQLKQLMLTSVFNFHCLIFIELIEYLDHSDSEYTSDDDMPAAAAPPTPAAGMETFKPMDVDTGILFQFQLYFVIY